MKRFEIQIKAVPTAQHADREKIESAEMTFWVRTQDQKEAVALVESFLKVNEWACSPESAAALQNPVCQGEDGPTFGGFTSCMSIRAKPGAELDWGEDQAGTELQKFTTDDWQPRSRR